MEVDDPILALGRKYFGLNYLFPYQRLAIHNILLASGYFSEGEDPSQGDQIILLPTGAGKSLCFQLPALLLPGLTLVVYPLLSLIADQCRRLEAARVPSGVLRGNQSPEERKTLFNNLAGGQVKILLTNPETLMVSSTLNRLKQFPLTHFVVDEAHCICQWGESFRPSYLRLEKVRSLLNPKVTTAFTATASPEVLEKITQYLFPDSTPHIISANPDRPNLYYSVEQTVSKKRTLRRLLALGSTSVDRPVVIFCRSRKETELLCLYLRTTLEEEEIYFYHAGLSTAEKKQIENWFFQSSTGILTATTAYGMGVDKANIRTVIHMEAPSTVEAYLQESGRAGRDSNPSRVLLLVSPQDRCKISPFFQQYSNTRTCLRQFLYQKLGAELD
ncbi:MAG: RecQ family ATP-dependent DNA helicase, partial [Spirochaetales bacterium]